MEIIRNSAESSNSSSETKKSSDKTKNRRAGSKAVGAEVAGPENRRTVPRRAERSLLAKLDSELKSGKDSEAPLFGIAKPEKPAKTSRTAETKDAASPETVAGAEPDQEQLLAMVATDLATHKLQAAESKVQAQRAESAGDAEPEALASAAFLRGVRDVLNRGGERPADETAEMRLQHSLDEAERSIRDKLDADAGHANDTRMGENSPEGLNQADPEQAAETSPSPMDSRERLADMDGENDTDDPATAAGDSGNRLPPTPPNLPPKGTSSGPNGPNSGPSGRAFNLAGNWPAHPAFGSERSTTMAETVPMMPISEAISNEHAAQSRGLLVGLVGGFLYGRHRGRKQGAVKARREAAPGFKKLEKRVQNLQDMITAKERQVARVTAEKFQSLQQNQTHKNELANVRNKSAAAPERILRAVGEVPPAAFATAEKSVRATPETRTAFAAGQPAGELYSRVQAANLPPSAELLINDRYRREFSPTTQSTTGSGVERIPKAAQVASEQGGIIRFDKKAEDFSRDELMRTAEKIQVQGVNLKEMVQLGSLDERGLRHVVAEFLEGGNVSAAVAREVKEKEIKYERDPRMRQAAKAAGGVAAGAVTVDSAVPPGKAAAEDGSSRDSSRAASVSDDGRPQPRPDDATLAALRNRQAAMLGGTVLVIIAFILLALAISG